MVELGVITQGQLVGEVAFLANRARSATVVAVEPSIVMELHFENKEAIMKDQPAWFKILIEAMVSHIHSANRKIGQLSDKISELENKLSKN